MYKIRTENTAIDILSSVAGDMMHVLDAQIEEEMLFYKH